LTRLLGEKEYEDQFRNHLCEQIAKIVQRADSKEGDALVVEFEDSSTISVSLKEDYSGAEAVIFYGHNDLWAVI
jgi:hypothetical protein